MYFFADCRGQCKADVAYLSVPDVQAELIVHVQFATVQPHKSQGLGRHLGWFRSDAKPAADSRIVLVVVLQGSTRRLR